MDREPLFRCKVCGKETLIAPDPPAQAICEDCCEDHDYRYDNWCRGKFCIHCDKQEPIE